MLVDFSDFFPKVVKCFTKALWFIFMICVGMMQ